MHRRVHSQPSVDQMGWPDSYLDVEDLRSAIDGLGPARSKRPTRAPRDAVLRIGKVSDVSELTPCG